MSEIPQNLKTFIVIKSGDRGVCDFIERIETYTHFWLWVARASHLLDVYFYLLDHPAAERDLAAGGKRVAEIESHFMSAVNLYLRCFISRPKLFLHIQQITKEEIFLACFKSLRDLRDDEFVHWKGVRSKVEIRYSFEPISTAQVNLARELSISYTDKFGPGADEGVVRQLFTLTLQRIEQLRENELNKLRERLQIPEVFLKTKFLNPSGESVIRGL